MTNLAATLKSEIARIARKEVKAETQQLKTIATKYRAQIASMRKQIQSLERRIRTMGLGPAKRATQIEDDSTPKNVRFSPSRLAAHRKRLNLSAREMGALIGVSALSVYKWESGKARPRAKQLEGIANVRRLGRREAAARLSEINS